MPKETLRRVGSTVEVGATEGGVYPNTRPTLVPFWLLSTGPPASSSTPVTARRPTRKIRAVAPISNGSRLRRGGSGNAVRNAEEVAMLAHFDKRHGNRGQYAQMPRYFFRILVRLDRGVEDLDLFAGMFKDQRCV